MRDEASIVVSGGGQFFNGEIRRAVSSGDFIFVAAGVEHRFESFSDDLAVWAIFFQEKVRGFEKEPVPNLALGTSNSILS